ncbi:MAG: ribbon-helix-helix domain-containing protein [Candidatus Bathyarchaeia archaeon]
MEKSPKMVVKMEKTKWSIPVPKTLDEALEEAVKKGAHASKSDFIREAVRRRLEELGYKPQIFQETRRR